MNVIGTGVLGLTRIQLLLSALSSPSTFTPTDCLEPSVQHWSSSIFPWGRHGSISSSIITLFYPVRIPDPFPFLAPATTLTTVDTWSLLFCTWESISLAFSCLCEDSLREFAMDRRQPFLSLSYIHSRLAGHIKWKPCRILYNYHWLLVILTLSDSHRYMTMILVQIITVLWGALLRLKF